MKNKNKKQKGYTLMEILIVVVIIGVMGYFSMPLYNKIINKADVADALHNIDMLSGAQAKYFITNGRYTGNLKSLETPLKGADTQIDTTRFNYYIGDPREDNYCIYSTNKSKDYVLAKNYKTNSKVLCNGSDCGKIESFVKEGNLEELCGANGGVSGDDCNNSEESCKALNNNWTLLPDCTCGCSVVAHCTTPGEVWNSEKCVCEKSDCDKTDEYCKKMNENYILDADNCDCKCDLSEEKCKIKGLIFNQEKCVCEKIDCDKTAEECKKENVNWTLLPDCTCGCSVVAHCTTPGEVWNSEKCVCEKSDCEKTDEYCKKMNENYILDADNCDCKCDLSEEKCKEQNEHYLLNNSDGNCSCYCALSKRDCAKWNLVYNASSCACEEQDCDKTLAQCQAMNSNYILNSNCNCVCGLEEKDCTSQGLSFNNAKCKCEGEICDKTEESCKKFNANWTLLPDCTCGCPTVAHCTTPGSAWNSETCSCEKTNCNGITDEYCKEQNPNYYLEGTKCRCLCGIDKFSCGLQGLWFNIDTCYCEQI